MTDTPMTDEEADAARRALALQLAGRGAFNQDPVMTEAAAALTDADTRLARTAARLDQLQQLIPHLEAVTAAGHELVRAITTVKANLDHPYVDDARWTPYTRFVEYPWTTLARAIETANRALHDLTKEGD